MNENRFLEFFDAFIFKYTIPKLNVVFNDLMSTLFTYDELIQKLKQNVNYEHYFLNYIKSNNFIIETKKYDMEKLFKNIPNDNMEKIIGTIYDKIYEIREYVHPEQREMRESNIITFLITFQKELCKIMKSKNEDIKLFKYVRKNITYDEYVMLSIDTIFMSGIMDDIPEKILIDLFLANLSHSTILMQIVEYVTKYDDFAKSILNLQPTFFDIVLNNVKSSGIENLVFYTDKFHKTCNINLLETFDDVDKKLLANYIAKNKNILSNEFIADIIKIYPDLESMIIQEYVSILTEKHDKKIQTISKKRTISELYDNDDCEVSIICNICKVNIINKSYISCGHTLCDECHDKIGHMCPYCRTNSQSHKIII